MKDLSGKRLAITKGAGPSDSKFVSNVIFAGDLDAQKHFKLVSVPNVESALKMLEAKGAEAALVPLVHAPKDAQGALPQHQGAGRGGGHPARAPTWRRACRSWGPWSPSAPS